MKNSKSNSKKNKKRTVNTKNILAVFFVIIIAFLSIYTIKKKNKSFKVTPEILRSREYDVVQAGDEKTNSDCVLFDAFFLKDLDGDGKADSIRGTCNEIGKQDTLYMDLKIINNGHFKDGVITINSSNFNLATTLVKDQIIAQNYISENTKTIKLKDIQNGNQKLITGIVRAAIGNDTNNYTKINSVTLTGTHVDDNGHETPINKTINFTVDWYGTVETNIESKNINNEVDNLDQLLEGENVKLQFDLKTYENKNQLILKSANLEGTIPELNGYKPTSFSLEGDNLITTYDAETGKFTTKREAQLNNNHEVTKKVETSSSGMYRFNTYRIKLTYPREAYDNMEGNNIELLIPIKTWYEGYNNPNEQFENPYTSNVDETTVIARWVKYSGNAYRLDIYVWNYDTFDKKVSKEKPLKIYDNLSQDEKEDYYMVEWDLSTGKEKNLNGVILKETKNGSQQVSDQFIKKDSSSESMENLTTNVGIYFVGSASMLGENGWIKVYNDETNELIETFTKDNWDKYSKEKPYNYKNSIKHIRVETSTANPEATFKVCHKKELDDKYITENYTREEFDKLEHIKSTLTGYYGEDTSTVSNSAIYQAPYSLATIRLSKNETSTQETINNQNIKITTETNGFNQKKWKNGTFLVEIPNEIIDMKINSVSTNKSNVTIIGYDLYEEDGKYFIKIITENEKEESFEINIDCDMTPDPSSTTVTRNINLYATNENCMNYYNLYRDNDKYDINGNSNIDEIINYTKTNLSIISPNELVTTQIATDYDNENNTTVAPKVANVEKSQRTANIDIYFTNNYNQEITDVVLQGVIPFEGNQFIVGNQALGSTYSTWMSSAGITIPNELKQYATVYYSTEAKPTNDLTNESNKWKKAEEVTNWKDIKTYIIDFGEYKFAKGERHKFTYQVNIPEDVKYNDVAYSEHGIYFSILTDVGKYSTFTAANKLGLMIAKKYDLSIEKLQERTDKKIQGVTFKITEEGQEESKIELTDSNGKLTAQGLFAERCYIIKEIKTAEDYVLNTEEIKIYTYTDEQDNLYIKYKNEDGSYTNLEEKYSWLKNSKTEKYDNNKYKVKLTLENEVKLRLKIIKSDSTSSEKISNIAFNITGENFNKTYITDSNGEFTLKGLSLNQEYEINEIRKRGYYILDSIKFKVTKNNDIYSANIIQGNLKENKIEIVDYIPQLELYLENEKIPTYNLEVVKIEEGTLKENKKTLQNAEFSLKYIDNNEEKRFITNSNGKVTIDNLFQFVDGKDITGKYTLTETKAPNGYASNSEEINFKVKKNEQGTLEVNIENQDNLSSLNSVEVENNTVRLIIQNKPLFKLTKADKETGAKIKGAKFIIYELEEDGTETDFAKDINGNYVGTLNSKNQYEVITDDNGEITLPLRNGTYKALEIEAPKGYEKTPVEEIFKITGNEANQEIGTPDEFENTLEINYIEDLVDFSENVRNGNTYASTKVILKRTLDFADSNSYRDATDTQTYGDYNFDGNVDNIKTELTTGVGFRPIGFYVNDDNNHPFSGIFDGQNNEINGIYIDNTAETPSKPDNFNIDNAALFGYVKDAKIKNIGINGNVKSYSSYTAGLISMGENIQIYNCCNKCDLDTSVDFNGGIIGYAKDKIIIEKCSNEGIFKTNVSRSGGIIGYTDSNTENDVTIKSCYNFVNHGFSTNSGGIFGELKGKNISIDNCYNYGTINVSNSYCGGIGYRISGSESVKVSGCINYGDLIGHCAFSGGILSSGSNLKIYNCINYGNILCETRCDNIGGIGGNIFSCEIEKCINYGNIETSGGYIGGISGQGGIIKECSNYGTLKANSYIGGIAGYNGNIVNTYNKGDIYILRIW